MTHRSYVVPSELLPGRSPEWLQERRRRRKARKRVARGLPAMVAPPAAKRKALVKPVGVRNPIRQLRREWEVAMRTKGEKPSGRQWRKSLKTARRAEQRAERGE